MEKSLSQSLSLGTSSFRELRAQNQIYVDKTDLIYRLVKSTNKHHFLSRPRRFGKTLLVDTLACLFRDGIQDFHGLAIENRWDEPTYTVIRLDFSDTKEFDTIEQFNEKLRNMLAYAFAQAGKALPQGDDTYPEYRFHLFLGTQPIRSVCLLIDEYDAPLTNHLTNPELFEQVQRVLSSFYSGIKSRSEALRFLFITGVSPFSQNSIFSTFNNFDNDTLNPCYGTLLGYTREELELYFSEYLDRAQRYVICRVPLL